MENWSEYRVEWENDQPLPRTPEHLNAAGYFVDRHLDLGHGGRVAFHYVDDTLTYAQIAALVNRAGNALRGEGLGREQRLLLALPDCPEWIAVFFGAIKLGAVPVLANPAMTEQELAYVLDDSRAVLAV